MITSVITGDITNSREVSNDQWMPVLKQVLNHYGEAPKDWEIFRGDSFQLELTPDKAMVAAIHIKATVKQWRLLDVRMAIGIGTKSYGAEKITEANGSAFINSGEAFEALKKSMLAIKSDWPALDDEVNHYIELALLTMNNWPANAATMLKAAIEHQQLTQQQLAAKLKRTQSTVSEGLKRAGHMEIFNMEKRYRALLQRQWHN